MTRTITFQEYCQSKPGADEKVYITTWAGREEVTGQRWGEWIVCGHANAGFGISYMVLGTQELEVVSAPPAPPAALEETEADKALRDWALCRIEEDDAYQALRVIGLDRQQAYTVTGQGSADEMIAKLNELQRIKREIAARCS